MEGPDELEIRTAEWVDWFNRRPPLTYCDDLTPIEPEQAHYAHHQTPTPVGASKVEGVLTRPTGSGCPIP